MHLLSGDPYRDMNRAMSSLIPQLQSADPAPSAEPRVVALRGTEVDAIFETLSSEMRRTILKELYETPATPSELAEATETSLQNVHYHIEKLVDVDLIEAINTRYSSKGKEMKVYAPVSDPLIFVESEETRSQVESKLDRLVGVLSLLAIGSLLIQKLVEFITQPTVRSNGAFTAQTESMDVSVTAKAAETGPDILAQLQGTLLEPGTLVFLGGIIALLGYVAMRRAMR